MPVVSPRFLSPNATIVTGHHRHKVPGLWIHRPNGVREWVLHLTISGAVLFRFDGGSMLAEAGQIVLIRPGVPMDYGIPPKPGRWNVIWAVFEDRPAWAPWLRWPEVAPGYLHLHLQDRIIRQSVHRQLLSMHRLATSAQPQRQPLAINALEAALLWCQNACPAATAAMDHRIGRAMEFLTHNLSHKLNLRQIAAHAGISTAQLTRLFRRHVNCSVGEYLEALRLNRAKQLLDHTSLTICAIAWEVGFDNPFYFSARFRRMTGLSPREYRRRNDTMRRHSP